MTVRDRPRAASIRRSSWCDLLPISADDIDDLAVFNEFLTDDDQMYTCRQTGDPYALRSFRQDSHGPEVGLVTRIQHPHPLLRRCSMSGWRAKSGALALLRQPGGFRSDAIANVPSGFGTRTLDTERSCGFISRRRDEPDIASTSRPSTSVAVAFEPIEIRPTSRSETLPTTRDGS